MRWIVETPINQSIPRNVDNTFTEEALRQGFIERQTAHNTIRQYYEIELRFEKAKFWVSLSTNGAILQKKSVPSIQKARKYIEDLKFVFKNYK